MELVTVKNKFQIVIPQSIRERAGIGVGDLLEVALEEGRITFTPKSAFDLHLAEALADVRDGRTHGPYASATEALAASAKRAAKPKAPRQ